MFGIVGSGITNGFSAGLVLTGTLARCQDIRFIFSHGGGALPFLAARIDHISASNKAFAANNPRGILHELKRLYCDTASAESVPQLAAMCAFFPDTHILFGSDYPFIDPKPIIDGLDEYPMTKAMRAAIDRENALALLPRAKA